MGPGSLQAKLRANEPAHICEGTCEAGAKKRCIEELCADVDAYMAADDSVPVSSPGGRVLRRRASCAHTRPTTVNAQVIRDGPQWTV